MSRNILWGIILILLIANGVTLTIIQKKGYLTNETSGINVDSVVQVDDKVIATVGDKEIHLAELINKLESMYGLEMLNTMISQEVVFQLAAQENISISEQEIEREINFIKMMAADNLDSAPFTSEEDWEREIEYSLLLDELMTRDVVLTEQELETYYNENKHLYNLPSSYHLLQIIVSSADEANMVIEELNNGSEFSTLAMERSIDVFSAQQGGDIGYVSDYSDYVSPEYIEQAKEMNVGEWSSQPIKTEEGFIILYLKDAVKGKEYGFSEVKDQIRRQIAIQQMEGIYSPENLWSELGVEVLY